MPGDITEHAMRMNRLMKSFHGCGRADLSVAPAIFLFWSALASRMKMLSSVMVVLEVAGASVVEASLAAEEEEDDMARSGQCLTLSFRMRSRPNLSTGLLQARTSTLSLPFGSVCVAVRFSKPESNLAKDTSATWHEELSLIHI